MPSPVIQRSAIVIVALLAAAGIVQAGLAERLSRSDPALAARLAPHDARIAMAAARKLVDDGGDATGPAIRALAATALSRDLTQTAAIEFRAVEAEGKGDRARAEQLIDLSDAISRRSLPTRLWLIQRSVDRGDVGGALRDFDLALRTSSAAPSVLLPVLAGATTDPGLVRPIARMLDRPSDWRVMFLDHAVAQGDARGIAAVLLAMCDRQTITANGIDQALIARLVGARDFALAGRLRDAFAPSAGPRPMLADGAFGDIAAPPFGWSLVERGEIGAERGETNGRSSLMWRAEPGRGGQVAAQLLMLAPGKYRLASRTASSGDATPYWSLRCGEQGGAMLATLDQPGSAGAAASTDFVVASGCIGQWLTLTLRPGGGSGGQSGGIAAVTISRL
ncbi:MAG: hypothetical protein ACTHJR_02820 [Sphingomonas sp.]|uniref:hypothetical protein n=1 Tax=Sphingomonas sp. TaxID=28214 RepID=UPI003F7D41FD